MYVAREICIDLGTSNTVISEKNKGIILCEPTVAAVDSATGKIIAAGSEAEKLMGKTPAEISVICPIKSGVVADFDVCVAMLRTFFTEIFPKGALRPKGWVCIPSGITQVEKSTLIEAITRAGIKCSYTIDSPVASAMGAGLEVSEPSGNMILDVGGGKSNASVLSFGGIITCGSASAGGKKIDNHIAEYIRKNLGVRIGEKTAEKIKLSIADARSDATEKTITVTGRSEKNGLPREITVTQEQVYEAVLPCLYEMAQLVKDVLSDTPPELCYDLKERGIYLCGGGARLCGLAEFVEENTGFCATLCNDAHLCSATGVEKFWERGAIR